ncbi:hypothetical protein Asppvi_005424 [Aspergillus pseudoviridinutans]|uniref:NWD NACHT-NTPase N-terminal domain-containing protein n=1 Tax=Aspergillus pseudoviridinutans TaxID=1517512 RepID=A0A9P3BC01_9EURO|nr:uncharacterized protein Asppvi_005424 [Aspergillus pseudoviridinutans]GIJ86535.1 hypothetical protein Asppvi_005424 [Aspergillus pseudoviridinutans]
MGPRKWWKRRVHKGHESPSSSSHENPNPNPDADANPPLTNPEPNPEPAPPPQSLNAARDALWRKAYKTLRAEQPDAIANYVAIVKDDANLPQDAILFDHATFAAVPRTQKQKMENKQWTYPWFDRPRKIRDTIEAIQTVISESSPIISAGMNFAPIFVSLPWSFISLLISFAMRDYTEMQNAIDGLKVITCILSSYSLAEEEFLSVETTRVDFEATVLGMYTKMLEFQAAASQYFAAGTLRRLGRNVRPGTPWQDALAAVEQAEKLCHMLINALAVRLQRRGFESLQTLFMERTASLNKAIDEASARRNKSRQVTEWISLIDSFQDHGDVGRRLGDE